MPAMGRYVSGRYASQGRMVSRTIPRAGGARSGFVRGMNGGRGSTNYFAKAKAVAEAVATEGKTAKEFHLREFLGKNKKMVAGGVAGALVLNGMRHRSGRAADRVSGRPTGMYGF